MYERGFWFFQNGFNPKAVNSFGAMVPYMGPIFVIRYAMRRRKNFTWPKVTILTQFESQRQELPFSGSNWGKPFNRNRPDHTTAYARLSSASVRAAHPWTCCLCLSKICFSMPMKILSYSLGAASKSLKFAIIHSTLWFLWYLLRSFWIAAFVSLRPAIDPQAWKCL